MTRRAGRPLLAEFAGAALLVAVVTGSGIAATRLTGDGALRLLVSETVATAGLLLLIIHPARPGPAVREDRAAQLTG